MKKGNADIIVLIVLVVILIGLVVFFGIKLTDVKGEESTQITGGASEVKAEENVVTQEKQIEYREKEVYGLIDVSKNLEADNIYISKEYSTYVTKVSNGNAYVKFVKYGSPAEKLSIGTGVFEKQLNVFYKIEGVEGYVVDMAIVGWPTSGQPVVILLKNDGTVSTVAFDFDEGMFKNEIKVDGLKDIVRIDDIIEEQDRGEMGIYDDHEVVATDKYGNTTMIKWMNNYIR